MKFDFDPDKAAANPIHHAGVTFEEAKHVLLDPYVLTREDADNTGEARFVSLGQRQRTNSGGGVDATRRHTSFNFGLEGQPTATQTL